MRWNWIAAVAAIAFVAGFACAQAGAAELSTTNRLQDRREVAAGQRSYAEGFEDGRFYANGWHTTGEMGGVWAPPVKLVDGVWFGLDGSWIGPATRFTSGWGYTRYDLRATDGLQLERTDFAPDADRAVLFGLTLTNPGESKTVTVNVESHSELMGAYPWGSTKPNESSNVLDHGAFQDGALVFTDDGTVGGGAPVHHYAALVASNRTPSTGTAATTGGNFRGPQAGTTCAATDGTSPPSACDDGPFGRGTGGRLNYSVTVPAHGSTTLWIAVAGSDQGLSDARSQLAAALANPDAELNAKIASRGALAANTVVSLPGDRLLQNAITWGKQNLADLTQTASNLQIRWTDQGRQYPAPLGTVANARWFGAGYPDYPWIFSTDGEYTAFAAVALGQFETIEDHLRALRDISDILNHRSGIVVHETVSDGSVYFGHDSQSVASDGTVTNDFNTDETVKFPSAVALVWRWTGDKRFLDSMYDFTKRNMHAIDQRYDVDHDGWPEGSGNVERPGMGPEKLDNGVYYMRGLYDLADMARAENDGATASWATHLADRLRGQFEQTWWDPSVSQYADSLDNPGNTQVYLKNWIDQVPMEASLTTGTQVTPGVASRDHGVTALAARESPCFSGDRPGSLGLFHTACGGGADGKSDFEIFSLTTAIQAVGEGNYGRLGPTQQQRYTDANAETMFSEPATGGTPDEMPGAMPEIFPSSPNGDPSAGIPANIDRCWTCRSMVMQAWGNYGTVWPVVSQQLGVRPFLGQSALQVVPQVPGGQPSVAGSNIRLGHGSIDVFAARSGNRYTTKLTLNSLRLDSVEIGQTLPAGSRPVTVTLDGRAVHRAQVRDTNRGVEVTVPVSGTGPHTLEVTAG
ncbi:MAG: glycogen debranching protein [Solirubrobacteraceae bacterium]